MVIGTLYVPRKHKSGEDTEEKSEKHISPYPFLTVLEKFESKKQNLKSISMAPALSFLTSQPTKHF